MKMAIVKETRDNEQRCPISIETAKKYVSLGFEVFMENGAAKEAGIDDNQMVDAGVKIVDSKELAYENADVILKIKAPTKEEISLIKKDAVVIGHLNSLVAKEDIQNLAEAGISAFAMELMPRITRAQSMDILSSQSNLAGYKAVLEAANVYNSAFPMMMTAAGTVPPAKVFIMGAGVAGLQAIATAKRLGAIVTAYDVRPATKEQVESLGGKFVVVDEEAMKEAETSGGYAKEMTEEYKKKEQEVLAKHVQSQDIIITTALIPGRPAPKLISKDMVKSMKTGSVIVDMATEMGGNVEGSKLNTVQSVSDVKIIGYANLAGMLPKDASTLFAKNILNFLSPHIKEGKLEFDFEDETVSNTLVTQSGKVVGNLPWLSNNN